MQTKLTKPLRAELVAAVEAGCSYRTACGAAGIAYSTLKRWTKQTRGPGRSLRLELERARHRLELNCLKSINAAALDSKSWTAAAWLLQNRVGGPYLASAAALRRPPAADRVGFSAADAARALDEAEAETARHPHEAGDGPSS